jgi:dihydropteroate synthase
MTWTLHSRRPLPGAHPDGDGWTLRWDRPAVMGVLNVTPDSFSDGGDLGGTENALARAQLMAAEGALIVDIGGESTRPGSQPMSVGVELDRVVPVVARLSSSLPDTVISVDTRKPAVAAAALEAGAHVINNVGALRDEAMTEVCAAAGVPVVLMHMQGEPESMQQRPHYNDVVREVRDELHKRAEAALARGVPSVLVDPGIGFGKTLEHNLALLRSLDALGPYPVLVGASRKGMIHLLSPEPDPRRRLPGTLAIHLWAVARGTAVVRAHDVAAHVQALKVWNALADGESS